MRNWQLALAVIACSLASTAGARNIGSDKLKIVEGVSGIDPVTHYVKIRGEIWNNSGQWINAPRVNIELFDANGKSITVSGFLAEHKRSLGTDPRDGVMAQRNFVPPDEVAVFEYLRDPAKLGAQHASHKLEANAWAVEGTAPKMAIEGLKTAVTELGYFEVSGTIRNVGTVPCRSPKAVLGFYTADGKVMHATDEEPDEMFQKQLAPGKTVPFFRKNIMDAKGAKDVKAWGDCADPE
jgi:hypothetical protein